MRGGIVCEWMSLKGAEGGMKGCGAPIALWGSVEVHDEDERIEWDDGMRGS